MDIGL
ncbi:hypothetical protein YPPY56_3747, partial [Yersinia pestis PY-56]|jgi:hypothetical protein